MPKAATGKLAFDVVPGTTLDPAEQQCVLAALSTLDVDESATAWAGLNARPTGFTSLITIECGWIAPSIAKLARLAMIASGAPLILEPRRP